MAAGTIASFKVKVSWRSQVAYAIDILTVIIQSSPKPLSDAVIIGTFPALIGLMLSSDDNEALNNGCECLRVFADAALEQIVAFNHEGTTGIQYMMRVVVRLLQPETPEGALLYVGKLIGKVLSKVVLMRTEHGAAFRNDVLI